MQTKVRRPRKDSKAKLSAAERKRANPPPVDRGAFEEVIRGLVTTPPLNKRI
jgi:hypothetical protein